MTKYAISTSEALKLVQGAQNNQNVKGWIEKILGIATSGLGILGSAAQIAKP